MDSTTSTLAAYASTLAYDDISSAAVFHAAKRCLIDSLGCAFGAFHEAPTRALRKMAEAASGKQPATVIGLRSRSTPELAALANGAMIRCLDFSDDYFGGRGDIGPHPSDNIGSLLAAAESAGADGRALLLGVIIAYEVVGRFADAIDFKGTRPSWDYTTLHAIASALGASSIWRLSYEQTRSALAIAAVSNIGLLQTRTGELSHWKGLAGPYASRNGLGAAMMAREGVTGPDDPLEGKAGWMKHLNMPLKLTGLGGNGAPFKVESTFHKFMPVRYAVQLAIWTALDLRGTLAIEEIESIRVYVVRRYVTSRAHEPEAWAPLTRETADHSFPYLIAAALVDGEVSDRTFTPERFTDPTIRGLANCIELAEESHVYGDVPESFQLSIGGSAPFWRDTPPASNKPERSPRQPDER